MPFSCIDVFRVCLAHACVCQEGHVEFRWHIGRCQFLPFYHSVSKKWTHEPWPIPSVLILLLSNRKSSCWLFGCRKSANWYILVILTSAPWNYCSSIHKENTLQNPMSIGRCFCCMTTFLKEFKPWALVHGMMMEFKMIFWLFPL